MTSPQAERLIAAITTFDPALDHPTDDELIAYTKLTHPSGSILHQHIHSCPDCLEIVQRLQAGDQEMERLGEQIAEAFKPMPFPAFGPKIGAVLVSKTHSSPVEAKVADVSYLRLATPELDAAATRSPTASRFKGLSFLLSDYRSTNRRTIAKVAGDRLSMQDFSKLEGYLLETSHGEVRLYCNLREHNGTTDIVFALKLHDAASTVSFRWERHFADMGRPPGVRILTFTSAAPRVEFFGMQRPDDSETWSFECIDAGGVL